MPNCMMRGVAGLRRDPAERARTLKFVLGIAPVEVVQQVERLDAELQVLRRRRTE